MPLRKITFLAFSLAIFLVIFSSSLAFAQQESSKIIKETYSSSFYIDKNGNAKHQVTVSYPPSSYSDYLKSVPDILKNQVAGAMESDYSIFGWKVKNVKAEVRGLGKEDTLKVIASAQIENMAKRGG